MIATRTFRRSAPALAVIAPLALLAGTFGPMAPAALAAPPVKHHVTHHLNIIQKHPTLTAVAAGAATHHILKKRAAYKKAHHQKLNFAEKHPTLSAIGVGVATHHVIKKTTPHH